MRSVPRASRGSASLFYLFVVLPLLLWGMTKVLPDPGRADRQSRPGAWPRHLEPVREKLFAVRTEVALRGLRKAERLYALGHDGRHPPSFEDLARERASGVPVPSLLYHEPAPRGETYGWEVCDGPSKVRMDSLRDSGAFALVSQAETPCQGHIFVDCTHTDANGRAWASY